jgi:hypothetical protein
MYFGRYWQRLGGYWDIGDGNGMDILGLFGQGSFSPLLVQCSADQTTIYHT